MIPAGLILTQAILILLNVVVAGALWLSIRTRFNAALFLAWLASLCSMAMIGLVHDKGMFNIFLVTVPTGLIQTAALAYIVTSLSKVRFAWKLWLALLPAGFVLSLAFRYAGLGDDGMQILPAMFVCQLPLFIGGGRSLLKNDISLPLRGLALFSFLSTLVILFFGIAMQTDWQREQMLLSHACYLGLSIFAPAALLVNTMKEKANLEAELRYQTALTQTAKMSALGQLAGGVAHEINNPLAIIQMASELVRNDLVELQKKTGVPTITGTLERVNQVIKAVRRSAAIVASLKRVAGETEETAKERTTMGSVVNETLNLCREQFRDQGITLVEPHVQDDADILARPGQISQALLNVLLNAQDAVISASTKKISIDIRRNDGWVEVGIQDTGPGVAPNVREKIFDPFVTTKEIGKGTGLGLSVARSFAKAHGGELLLEGAAAGARFVLRLPVAV